MDTMCFTVQGKNGEKPLELNYERVFAIGYAGRNIEKTMEHIKELERELGVPAPKKIPTIFQCGNYVLTQEKKLAFVGEKTCGEVEYVIVIKDKTIYIGLGSDHTDRELEAASVPKAKQICAKPICDTVWETLDGMEVLYQEGTLADILPVETILKELDERVGGIDNCVIFSGTVPVKNGFRFGSKFRYEMEDKKLNRKLSSEYEVDVISEEER